jgi:hypothetical protein
MAQKNTVILNSEIKTAESFKVGEDILVNVKITNTSNQDINLLIWNTPLEGFKANLFEIIDDSSSEVLKYQGIMVKRGNPPKKDYIQLKAGASVDALINLKEAYNLSEIGTYSLKLKFYTSGKMKDKNVYFESTSNTIKISIE